MIKIKGFTEEKEVVLYEGPDPFSALTIIRAFNGDDSKKLEAIEIFVNGERMMRVYSNGMTNYNDTILFRFFTMLAAPTNPKESELETNWIKLIGQRMSKHLGTPLLTINDGRHNEYNVAGVSTHIFVREEDS